MASMNNLRRDSRLSKFDALNFRDPAQRKAVLDEREHSLEILASVRNDGRVADIVGEAASLLSCLFFAQVLFFSAGLRPLFDAFQLAKTTASGPQLFGSNQ